MTQSQNSDSHLLFRNNRFEVFFLILHCVLVLPPVRQFFVGANASLVGIMVILFVFGLWLMRYEISCPRKEFLGNFKYEVVNDLGSNRVVKGNILDFSVMMTFYFGGPMFGGLIGVVGFTSVLKDVFYWSGYQVEGSYTIPEWTILPVLVFGLFSALLMWGVHLQPDRVRKECLKSAPYTELERESFFARARRPFIDFIIAFVANAAVIFLIDTVGTTNLEEGFFTKWIYSMFALVFLSVISYLPLQFLIWRLRNEPVSRVDVLKVFGLFALITFSLTIAPNGIITWFAPWLLS